MDPQFLLKDELEYELACRGVVLKTTAPVMKKLLTELLQTEQSEGSAHVVKAPQGGTVKYELDICAAKLNVLSNYISELCGKPDSTLFKRLVSRLYHAQNRFVLLNHELEDDGIRKEGLLQQCQVLLGKLEGQDDIVEEEDLSAEDKEILETTLGDLGRKNIEKLEVKAEFPEGRSSPLRGTDDHREHEEVEKGERNVSFITPSQGNQNSRPRLVRSSTIYDDVPNRKLVPISQWGLKFSGNGGLSINAFIERVLEIKDARNATELDLWRCAIDFFEGDALIWFRANREYAANWTDLMTLLKRTFQAPFYQDELLAEIKLRTQGRDESIIIYIAVMQNMFNRLPRKLPEHEKEASKSHRCGACGAQFVSVDALQRHATGGCDTLRPCLICGEGFSTDDKLTEHSKIHQKSNVKCEECNRSFAHQKSYSLHYHRIHLRPAPRAAPTAVCETCGKRCASKAALRYHQRSHAEEKPYPCTVYPKRFAMPMFLQNHMRTHTGERPFACPRCGKAFSSHAALVRHNRVHTGAKPYKCPECDKRFTQSNSMKLHMRCVHRQLSQKTSN